MDQFGVLVDEYHGFKSAERSAPLSKLKQKPKQPSYFTPSNTSNTVGSSSYELDVFFTENSQTQTYFGNDDVDIFDGVRASGNSGSVAFSSGNDDFDIFGGVRTSANSASVASNSYDDLLGLNSEVVHDDVFGILGPKPTKTVDKKASGYEVLITGFGLDSSNQGKHTKADPFSESNSQPNHLGVIVDDDPLQFFAQDQAKDSKQVSLDDLDDFFNNQSKSPKSVNIDDMWQEGYVKNATAQGSEFDFFSNQGQKPVPPPDTRSVKRSVTPSPVFNVPPPGAKMVTPSVRPSTVFNVPPPDVRTVKRSVTPSPVFNLWDDDAVLTDEFQEIDKEPRERREARWKRYMRVKERMDEALAVKNQRDFESQYEQEEKRRLAETLEKDIKLWSAGREGNLRALLSSLQQVLWPECGWRPISLTDLITSDSVKKVYRKATLYVHPDKVQQKGANLQQKYIAEKVFDILKEAWNKFSSEELR